MAGEIATAAVQIVADTRKFDEDLRRKLQVSVKRAGRAAGKDLSDGMSTGARGTGTKIAKDVSKDLKKGSGGAGRRAGRDAGNSFSDAFRRIINHRLAKGALSGLLAPLTGTLAFAGASVAAVGIANLTTALLSLSAAVAPAAGALTALPAAAAAAAGAMATLKVALSGVGDAFEAALTGDAEEFAESLEGLAPAARNVARELRGLREPLYALRNSVQQGFFAPLQGELTALVETLGGPLQDSMTRVARTMGLAARDVSEFAREGESVAAVVVIMRSLQRSIQRLRPAIRPALAGMRALATSVAPLFEDAADAVTRMAQRFGEWATEAADSGRAVQWVRDAVEVIRELGRITSDITATLRGVFRAVEEAGGDALGTLGAITSAMRRFVESAEGQETLVQIFTGIRDAASALGPVIREIVRQIGLLAPTIAAVAKAAGPGLQALVQGIGEALRAAGPGVTEFITALSSGLQELVQSGTLTKIGEAFGSLLRAISPLVEPLSRVMSILGSALADAIIELAPHLEPIAEAFGDILEALLPAIPPLVQLTTDILTGLLELLPIVAPLLIQLAEAFAWVAQTVQAAWEAMGGFQTVLDAVWQATAGWLVQYTNGWSEMTTNTATTVQEWSTGMGATFQGLWDRLVSGAVEWVNGMVEGVRNLPSRMIQAVIGLVPGLSKTSRDAMTGFQRNVEQISGSVVEFFRGVPKRIFDALSTLAGYLLDTAVTALKAMYTGFSTWVVNIYLWFAGLPNRIVGWLSGIGTALYKVGVDLIMGMVRGVRAAADRLADAAISVVRNAIAGAREALGIRSPSRVFEQIGRQTIAGYVRGLEKDARRVEDASRSLFAPPDLPAVGGPRGIVAGAWLPQQRRPWDTDRAAREPRGGPMAGATINQTVNLPTADPDTVLAVLGERLIPYLGARL